MKDINDILARHFSGEDISKEEADFVAQWKAENEDEFNTLSEAWSIADATLLKEIEFKKFDQKSAWDKVDSKLVNHKETRIIQFKFYKRVAAACAILLVGLCGMWFLKQGNSFETIANTDSFPKEIKLSDGSTIWLASNATLEYHKDFKNHRDLNLEGEAFFEVAKDKAHPFIVNTAFGNVEVLGTGFNVNATSTSTVVSVSHGKVALSNEAGKVELVKGQSAAADTEEITDVSTVEINFDSWHSGVFNFKDTPLEEVIELLNEHYETKIVLLNSKKSMERFTANINALPIEEIVEMIALTADLDAEFGDQEIKLK